MFASTPSPVSAEAFRIVALASACLFVFTLAFNHGYALRLVALTVAFAFALAAGGWREWRALPARYAWAAWAVAAAASVPWALDPRESLAEFRHEVIYGFAAFVTWFTLARQTCGARWLGLTVAITVAAVLALGAAMQSATSTHFHLGRYAGVGSLSTLLVTVLPVLLLLALLSPPRSLARGVALALALGSLVAGVLTLNRMFGIAAAVEITLFAGLSVRTWRTTHRAWLMSGVFLVAACFAAASLLLTAQLRIAREAPGAELGAIIGHDPRLELWRFALERIAEHPWLGNGIGKWSSSEIFAARFHDTLRLHAHNVFLNRALETGLPGMAAFVALLGVLAAAFVRMARSDAARLAVTGAAAVAMVAGIVLKNLTDDFFVGQTALLFWSLAGAVLGHAARDAGPAGNP
jgi:O-antigen ligase